MKLKVIYIIAAALAVAACSRPEITWTDGPIYPDYTDVTIPVGIAPLNFYYTDSSQDVTTTFSCDGEKVVIRGSKVSWNIRKWHSFIEKAAGKDISVSSSRGDVPDWTIHVSTDPIDYGVCYRLIAPGYETWSKMGIYERDLSSFKETPLIENTQFTGCVNCHSFNKCDPEDLSMHIRGPHGCSLLRIDGELDSYKTQTDSTLGAVAFAYWHPDGNYIAYSTNTSRQGFHEMAGKLLEVCDLAADVLVYDVRDHSLVTNKALSGDGFWETYPAFSPDGKTLYYCSAKARHLPKEVREIWYNLCSVDFDAETGRPGSVVDTLVFAEGMQKSVCFPKPSFDGRFLMYTLNDYGTFNVWHHESELWLLDLQTGETRPLANANSNDAEAYHNWCSNSRWFVFASRRDNGLFTYLYLCHIDENGNEDKAFMLPQRDPVEYYTSQYRSFNIPEFVTGPVNFDRLKAEKLINSRKKTPFRYKR